MMTCLRYKLQEEEEEGRRQEEEEGGGGRKRRKGRRHGDGGEVSFLMRRDEPAWAAAPETPAGTEKLHLCGNEVMKEEDVVSGLCVVERGRGMGSPLPSDHVPPSW